jgi:hypothetical protein
MMVRRAIAPKSSSPFLPARGGIMAKGATASSVLDPVIRRESGPAPNAPARSHLLIEGYFSPA